MHIAMRQSARFGMEFVDFTTIAARRSTAWALQRGPFPVALLSPLTCASM